MKRKPNIINIGRQFGSGGLGVANELGRMLGIPVYNNQLISKAAEESGFSEQFFASKDEKRSLFNIASFFSAGRYTMSDNYLSENELFRIQGEVITKLASEGPAIFVGRCSDYILREREDTLDVFVCAPLQDRIDRVSEREGISPQEAADIIRRSDRTRETYYNYFTFGNWGVASNYDLCIDSSILGIEGTAAFLSDYIRRMA